MQARLPASQTRIRESPVRLPVKQFSWSALQFLESPLDFLCFPSHSEPQNVANLFSTPSLVAKTIGLDILYDISVPLTSSVGRSGGVLGFLALQIAHPGIRQGN